MIIVYLSSQHFQMQFVFASALMVKHEITKYSNECDEKFKLSLALHKYEISTQ